MAASHDPVESRSARVARRHASGQPAYYQPGVPVCPSCGWNLSGEQMQTDDFVRCDRCDSKLIFHAFPALIREKGPVQSGQKVTDAAEASCFYHMDKVAELACDECGRFICGLCDLEMGSQHLCPVCFQASFQGTKSAKVERRRNLMDSVALWTAVLPILVWPFTIVTAPTAIFLAIRHWKTPSSVIGRTKARLVIAIVIALVQLSLWGIVFIGAFNL